MNPLDGALALAARGWFVFPVRDRRPLTPHGYKDGSTDPKQIAAWSERWPGCSWGIDLGRSGLIVLDVDVKKGKPGMAELEKLLPELPETYTAETPSGGLHLYYTRPEGWAPRRVIGWRPGLDLLSDGVLFAYPGDDAGLATAPNLFAGAPERPATAFSQSGGRPATPQVLRAARGWLEGHGPAVEGEGGNAHTVQAITKLCWDYGLSPEEAWPLLEAWNETCEPPWTEKELTYKIEHLHEGDSPRGLARQALELRLKKNRPAPAIGRLVDFEEALWQRSRTPWVSTPWPTLDEALGGGLPVGTVTLVAAGTGKGKTAFAAQLGAHHAQRAAVVYYMGELGGDMLAARVVAQRRRMGWADVLRGQVPRVEVRRLLEPLDFRVVERCEEPAEAVEAALDAATDAGPVMLAIDYVQLLADWADPGGVRQSVTLAMRWLLKLTAERKLVTLVISQTSRLTASMLRADGDVRAEDFVGAGAESSALEHDADNVLALRVLNDEGEAEVLVPKARLKGPGKVGMKFHGSSGRWEERDLDAAKAEKRDAMLCVIRDTLRRMNEGGVYPTKRQLQRECEVSSNAGWSTLLEALKDEVQIVERDPRHHIKLSRAGLFLKSAPNG